MKTVPCPRCGAPFGWLVCTECWDRELSFSAGTAVGEQPRWVQMPTSTENSGLIDRASFFAYSGCIGCSRSFQSMVFNTWVGHIWIQDGDCPPQPLQKLFTTGTPSDCVGLALLGILPEWPHLVVSGINLGSNVGHDVTYSGTLAAAMEATVYGIPAIASSMSRRRGFMARARASATSSSPVSPAAAQRSRACRCQPA